MMKLMNLCLGFDDKFDNDESHFLEHLKRPCSHRAGPPAVVQLNRKRPQQFVGFIQSFLK